MLHQITWQQYLLFVAGILLLYYGTIWLVFFRQTSGGLFHKKDFPLPYQQEQAYPDDLMGQSTEEYGVSTLDSDELNFGPGSYADEEEFEDQGLLQGDMADLLEELKSVFHYIGKHKPENKGEFIMLANLKIREYERIVHSKFLETVFLYISEQASEQLEFEVTPDEMRNGFEESEAFRSAYNPPKNQQG